MKDSLDLRKAQRTLLFVWALGTLVPFLLLLAQTVQGKYGDQSSKAWDWFIPAVVPTLTVIVGAIAYGASKPVERKSVDRLAFSAAKWVSMFYLALISATLLLQPFSETSPLAFLEGSSRTWLAAVHGLVGVSLGAFFTSTKG